jgi:hypothetical protein
LPKSVTSLKRSVIQVTANQINGKEVTQTIPNTREHQDQLFQVSTAGQYFSVTNGGAPMNSTDMLLAMERKQMYKTAEKLEKTRSLYLSFEAIAEQGKEIANSNKPSNTWRGKELAAAIRWKQGPTLPSGEAVLGMKVTALKELWETKYCNVHPPVVDWTDEMEFELQNLKAGETSFLMKTDIMREAAETENDFLRIKLQTISQLRQIDVIKGFLDSLPTEQGKVVIHKISLGNSLVNVPQESNSVANEPQGEETGDGS